MLKKINRVLKLLGLKIIRAKRKADEGTLLHSEAIKAVSLSCRKVEDDGKTHFLGDGCWPPHQEFQPPTSDTK